MMMRVNLGAAAPEEHVHWLKIIVFILSPNFQGLLLDYFDFNICI
jgi:hypothetical protein